MLTIQVCVGSSCFLKGSKQIIAEIENLIAEFQLEDKILLKGCFCHDKCTGGVTVTVGEKLYTEIKPEDVGNIFKQEILPAVNEGIKCL
ncbi:MAG: Respiratory-chain NADH dehydrogenase 24 Kd subunit [Firmicutes bacterium ADurb.Bin373]|nr:MAG: Respiratory-chain NADH dehydrogenase 24 Kd subunit [Firmicutes bacterium ADurb.Bin373]